MNGLINTAHRFLKRNSSTILSCLGAAGVVATAVTVAKDTPKALKLLEQAKEEKGEELTTIEKVKVAAPAYIPSALVGTTTIACVLSANALNKRQQAALTSAYALLDSTYKKYKDKVKEVCGEEQEQQVRHEIIEDGVKEFCSIVKPGDDDQILFLDEYGLNYFYSTIEEVHMAEAMVNRMLWHTGFVSLADLYELLDLGIPEHGSVVGWNSGMVGRDSRGRPHIKFIHTTVPIDDGVEDGLEVVCIGFDEPCEDYLYY